MRDRAMAIDVRSELRRPVTLALAALAGLLLIATIIQAVTRAQERREHQEQVTTLLQIQGGIRSELDQLKALAGTTTELQARIITGEKQIQETNQTAALTKAQTASLEERRKEAERKAGEIEQATAGQTQRLTELQTQGQQAEQNLAPLQAAAATP